MQQRGQLCKGNLRQLGRSMEKKPVRFNPDDQATASADISASANISGRADTSAGVSMWRHD